MSKFSVIVGHEATGVVDSIGEGVTTVKPGVQMLSHKSQISRAVYPIKGNSATRNY